MTSSDNFATVEPWTFRSTFTDSWFCEAVARDTETLTKALQRSISNNSDAFIAPAADGEVSPFFNLVMPEPAMGMGTGTRTTSGSGSDLESAASRQRNAIPVSAKRTKRKSRASKRSSTTTFIAADPANFRQMVQQVTGVRFGGNGNMSVAPLVLKPEPQRAVSRLQGCLPTLDTSAFLLQQVVGPAASAVAATTTSAVQQTVAVPPPTSGADSGGGLDFDFFPSFPTLESWKVL